jgi:hypothetical protein
MLTLRTLHLRFTMLSAVAVASAISSFSRQRLRAINATKIVIRDCALIFIAASVWAEPTSARSYLTCITKKVVIVDGPRGSTSSSTEENLGFWIDDAAKTLVLADGSSLRTLRFDERWISAIRGDTSYELDRQNGNLTYASSTTKENNTTIIIGSGQCKIAADPPRQRPTGP